MFGFSTTVSPFGRSINFRPSFNKFITNHKGWGIDLSLQSPIEFNILFPRKRSDR